MVIPKEHDLGLSRLGAQSERWMNDGFEGAPLPPVVYIYVEKICLS